MSSTDLEEIAVAHDATVYTRLRDLREMIAGSIDQGRKHPVDAEDLEQLIKAGWREDEEVPDAILWLLIAYKDAQELSRKLEFQLEIHRNYISAAANMLENPWPGTLEEASQKVQAALSRLLEEPSIRVRRWNADSDIYMFMERAIREYVQDANDILSVSAYPRLDEAKQALRLLEIVREHEAPTAEEHPPLTELPEDIRERASAIIQHEEAGRLWAWNELGKLLPLFWD